MKTVVTMVSLSCLDSRKMPKDTLLFCPLDLKFGSCVSAFSFHPRQQKGHSLRQVSANVSANAHAINAYELSDPKLIRLKASLFDSCFIPSHSEVTFSLILLSIIMYSLQNKCLEG